MGASLLITLREGLEISLVLAILVGYLAKTGRHPLLRGVVFGSSAAALVCIAAGLVVHHFTAGLTGRAEPAVEGSLALLAAMVLTWMIVWMRRNGRNISGELRTRLDAANGVRAVALVAFVAVAREGFETVLFLLGAEAGGSRGAHVVVGGTIGLAIAAVIGVLIYRFGRQINLQTFFKYTGVLLIVFAAGLVGKAVHEACDLWTLHGSLVDPLWTIRTGPLASGTLYDFLKGLFGWSNEPEGVRVAAYLIYLVVALRLFLRPDRVPTEASIPKAHATAER
jgi:high-affinity iron transporter